MSDKSELHRLFEKLNAALGPTFGWSLRYRPSHPAPWNVSVPLGEDGLRGEGGTPEEAMRSALAAVVAHAQGINRECEERARESRDVLNRLQRAIESP